MSPTSISAGTAAAGSGARFRPDQPAALLARLAAQQDGLFTRSQALACGFSSAQVRRRVASARWQTVLGPVLAPSGVRPTAALRDRAAVLAVPASVLAGPSAARRHGIPVPDLGPCLIVRPGVRVRVPGVRLLAEAVAPSDVVVVGTRAVTGVGRTVFDCLRVLPDDAARELLSLARRCGWISTDELADRLHRFAGRRGVKRLAGLCRCKPGQAEQIVPEPVRLRLFETERAVVDVVGKRAVQRGPARPAEPPARARPAEPAARTRPAEPPVPARFQASDLVDRPDLVLATLRALLGPPR